MTERVKNLIEILKKKDYLKNRVSKEFATEAQTLTESAEIFCDYMDFEEPVLFPGDRIGFNRYNRCYNNKAECDSCGNFAPSYAMYLNNGFDYVLKKMKGSPKNEFAYSAEKAILGIYRLCDKYKKAAHGELKAALERIPQNAPESYYEALVMMKIMIFSMRISGIMHVTLGRFDQYMYPFYLADIKRGVSYDEILEWTEEFFISINFDIDLYPGVQAGDDGQSLMLGGLNEDGTDSFSELSEICMKASMELGLIDPKINLRVNKNTPDSLYILGTEMTKQGLGFPQYNNDDVVIPGLIDFGYAPADAYNYSVAACWEFIVPDARDIPNIATVNFPKIVNESLYNHAASCNTYKEFFEFVKSAAEDECDRLLEESEKSDMRPPHIINSLFSESCIEKRKDYTEFGAKYNNYGFHGAGIANAADALCAIKKLIFEEKKYTAEEVIRALDANFEGFEQLHSELCACPKMGNNDDCADSLASDLMDVFCTHMKTLRNAAGGICRPGTGSAHEYIYSSRKVGATADGRYAFTPYSSSFSPAITSHTAGPLSVIQSFTKFDLKRIVNGGPLTIEIHDTTFRNHDGAEKVAQLVKNFILLGGHQLQLNSINREKLLDAQKHPGKYPNLIVRVWGWSGYFDELDPAFQNHIIKRTEYKI